MRSIALILLIAGVTSVSASAHSNSQAPSTPPSANANTAAKEKQQDCTISGMVVAMAGSVPLKNSLVTITSVDDR